jgi:hypothetical protein
MKTFTIVIEKEIEATCREEAEIIGEHEANRINGAFIHAKHADDCKL